jgi:hypothetical protein
MDGQQGKTTSFAWEPPYQCNHHGPAPPGSGIPSRYVAALPGYPGICLAYSNNGTEWTIKKEPIDYAGDTHNSIVYVRRGANGWFITGRACLESVEEGLR